MWAVELEGPGECEGNCECEESKIDKCGCGGCALSDGDSCDSENKEVIGPDDSKDKWWWLPWRLVEGAVPVISGVNPKARADYIDGDQGDACGGKKRFHLAGLRVIQEV